MSDEVDEKLREAAKRNFEMINSSETFCVLFNEKMLEEVIPVLQMGLAIYLDKPIVIVAARGAEIPMNVRRVAVAIEEYEHDDQGSFEAAVRRVAQKVTL